MNKTNFRRNKPSAIIAMLALLLVALGCGAEKPSAPPTEAEAQALVKDTMSQFADAVDKGDFTSFRANASKEFQATVNDEQIKTAFKKILDNKTAVVPAVREAVKTNAKFTPPPAVREEKGYSVLTANGAFDTDDEIKFSTEYVYQDGKWKLLKITFN